MCQKQICCLIMALLINFEPTNAANLLSNYLPVSMQALAYYIDNLQYEPLASTTVAPPFSVATDASISDGSRISTTTTIATTKSTTKRPNNNDSWWQPPSWWQNAESSTTTTTKRPAWTQPTPAHRPGLFAPPPKRAQPAKLEGYEIFNEIGDDTQLDKLPLSLIRDIQSEISLDDFTNDVESLDNFLRLYDDNYGRAVFDSDTAMDRWSSTSTAGKKRVPPTKPYVDFLLVYDLLKRDAKASNLSKYEGYSDEFIQDLYELSNLSAEQQLHTLFTRMLERHDIQRSDVVSRIQGIVKDLENPNSPTSKAMRYIPAMQFIP